jgi:hypothetical protein
MQCHCIDRGSERCMTVVWLHVTLLLKIPYMRHGMHMHLWYLEQNMMLTDA